MNVDPFFLLKEVSEMSKLYSQAHQTSDEQKYNRAQYNAFADSTYEKEKQANTSFQGFDPNSIEEKMKKFRFAKTNDTAPKDSNWFSKLQQNQQGKTPEKQSVTTNAKSFQIGVSKEDEIEIAKSMIP